MRQNESESNRDHLLRVNRALRAPISRRGLLELAKWSGLAAIAGATGCAANNATLNGAQDAEGGQGSNGARIASSIHNHEVGGNSEIPHPVAIGEGYPQITSEEGSAAVEQFMQAFNLTLNPENGVHSVRLMTSKNDPKKFIEVLIVPSAQEPHIPAEFVYKFPDNDPNKVPVRYRRRQPGLANVRMGHPARGAGVAVGTGTAGWNIHFDGNYVCVSCFHALCGQGNGTLPGTPVLLNEVNNATLYCFELLATGIAAPANLWDLAIAKYNEPRFCVGYYRQCDNGNYPPYTYPMSLTPNTTADKPRTGEWFHKVGAATPICRDGYLTSAGAAVSIRMPWGAWANFKDVLIFTRMTNPGDSGAVIVRNRDNTVSGLHFGASEDGTESYSNPLYKAPWTKQAQTVEVPADPTATPPQGSTTIPKFTTNSGAVPPRCCG
jgi:hypothetical protein